MAIRRVSLLGLVFVLVAGCTAERRSATPAIDPTPSSVGSASASPPPRPRGSVSVGFVGAPATLDPYSPRASDLTRALVRPLLPSLFRLLPDGTPEPYLAEELTEFDGGVRVTLGEFSWSDDRPVTARDVAASIGRARPPSGFAYIDSVKVLSPKQFELLGNVEDWPGALATSAYVLPRGRWEPRITSGPLEFVSYTENAELRLRASPGASLAFKTWRLRFFEQEASLISFLGSGDIDVGVLPSTVNLPDRLNRQDIGFSAALGWEWIGVRTDGSRVRDTLADAVDLPLLQESFIRDEGEVAEVIWPPAGESESIEGVQGDSAAGASFTVADPTGDELLGLMVSAIQLQVQDQGATMQLATVDARTFYGEWQEEAPVEALLMRSAGAPFLSVVAPKSVGADLPLFRVETFLAWSKKMAELTVNPTIEGPLWNLEEWRRAEDV